MSFTRFSWLRTHKELVQKLSKMRDRQTELIDVLLRVGINGLHDETKPGKRKQLDVMDPFTFFCFIYKHRGSKRVEVLQKVAKEMNVFVPDDDSGIPAVNALLTCMFPYEYQRKNNEINKLWDFFEHLLQDKVTDAEFISILDIRGISYAKITEGMFNIFPEKYLPINGPTKAYLKGVLNIDTKFSNYTEYLDILHKVQTKKDLPFYELSYESWKWNSEQDGYEMNNSENKKVNYWLYAPGGQADHWDEFRDQGIMGLGWEELGDLSKYKTKDAIEVALRKKHSDKENQQTAALNVFQFKEEMSIGDIIFVKKGRGELLGYGIVSSDYFYDADRPDFNSCRKVDWKLVGKWKTDHVLTLKSLTNITNNKKGKPKFSSYPERLFALMKVKPGNDIAGSVHSSVTFPLNTIFYGPPGTGKTYHSIKRAAEIIENRKINDYDEALRIFNQNLHDRIEFITFHQNYSYEDFVQGLRPDTENDIHLTFERKDGIFKLLSQKALENLRDADSLEMQKLSFEDAFKQVLSPLTEEQKEIEMKMSKVSYFITDVSKNSLQFRKASGGTAHTLSINTLKRMYEAESVNTIQSMSIYYEPLLNKLLEVSKKRITKEERIPKHNYVLIIDEINRANISRVFGELITLIEPDKRSHGAIPLKATLPSGDDFVVPSNLYIIGTMNTADKSIALLDIALRRRFEFDAMYPLYEINGEEVPDAVVLQKLNALIIDRKGYDFQIGHSYFMDDSLDLIQRMNRKVIPLLLEYFMNDEKEVKEILQSVGLKIEPNSWPIKIMH
ncbi:MAG: AAA family ATPase [Ignavibacteria bacterium]|jgi:5-methylcytosine-specific restriction protein B